MIRAGMKPPPPMAEKEKQTSARQHLFLFRLQGPVLTDHHVRVWVAQKLDQISQEYSWSSLVRTEFLLDPLCRGLAQQVDVIVCLSEAILPCCKDK